MKQKDSATFVSSVLDRTERHVHCLLECAPPPQISFAMWRGDGRSQLPHRQISTQCGIHNAINIINHFQRRNCFHIQPTTFGCPKKIIMAASAFAACPAFSSSEPGLFCKSICAPKTNWERLIFRQGNNFWRMNAFDPNPGESNWHSVVQCTRCTEAREPPPVPTPQIQDMHGWPQTLQWPSMHNVLRRQQPLVSAARSPSWAPAQGARRGVLKSTCMTPRRWTTTLKQTFGWIAGFRMASFAKL